MRVGVIDVGTNSVRVLVADVEGRRVADLERDLVITRLGRGVDRAGRLGGEPVRRTVEAVAGFWRRCEAAGVERARIAATSAVRDAANRDEFLAAVRRATGLSPDVLDGEEEAALGFLGATAAIGAPPPYLVCDIGGGSTEVVLGASEPQAWASVDVGSVRLTERHVAADPPSGAELAAVAADADESLARATRAVPAGRARTLVGLAGTITTLAAVSLGLEGYDRDAIHHHRLPRAEVERVRRLLAAMTSADRRALPAMPPGREDVIVAGAVLLERVMEAFVMGECLVSEADILDGLALRLAG